jgi:hypothetical protein
MLVDGLDSCGEMDGGIDGWVDELVNEYLQFLGRKLWNKS